MGDIKSITHYNRAGRILFQPKPMKREFLDITGLLIPDKNRLFEILRNMSPEAWTEYQDKRPHAQSPRDCDTPALSEGGHTLKFSDINFSQERAMLNETSPLDGDSDADGLADGAEDSDHDGLWNWNNVTFTGETCAWRFDSDTDGLGDGKGGTDEATVTFKVKRAPTPGFELVLAALALAGAAALLWKRRR
ncbi:MAG: PGF-CTERM sorting domain-containing protein [Thermoplasmata archaeon]